MVEEEVGGGGQASPIPAQQSGQAGGDGGITIIENIPLSSVTTISYSVGTGGSAGLGKQINPLSPSFQRASTSGGAGNSTNVVVSSTTYTANGGGGGQTPPVQPTFTPPVGTITPATQTVTTATLNGPLAYQSTPDRVITVSTINYCQGGAGGNGSPTVNVGNNGQAGRPGYVRLYFYP